MIAPVPASGLVSASVHPEAAAGGRSDGASAGMMWTVVIPAKAPARAKTRLAPHVDDAARVALARAFAADTVAAALAAESVARVIVVGDDPSLASGAEFLDERAPGTAVGVPGSSEDRTRSGRAGANRDDHRSAVEDTRSHGAEMARRTGAGAAGLARAIGFGIAHARATGAARVAVLLGDVPCLRPEDLDGALVLAAEHPLAFVRDAEGTGTTLATALGGQRFEPRFGPDSAAEHARAGFVQLDASARLRRDVDTLAALEDAIALGTGAHTAHVLATLADS